MPKLRFQETESSTLELKGSIPKSEQIIKTMIAFCNYHGGKLIIGVEDDLTVTGLSDKQLEECLEWVEKAVYEASFPPIIPSVSLQKIDDKTLLIIEVSSGMNKPYYRRSEGIEKGTYIRLGRNTVRASPETIEELRWQSIGVHFETLPIHKATLEDLERKKITKFLEQRKNGADNTFSIETLKTYGLVLSEHAHTYPTTAGMLIFGKAPQNFFPEAMCICTHFQGTEGRDVIATIDCEGDLFVQFNTAYDFILSRMTKSFKIDELQREEKLEIPKKAVREALLNAFVHRNYHISSPIKIGIWADRIEIFSPGSFPGPIDVNNLRAGRSYIRNPHICKIFREAGYIEKLGSGFIVMLDSYRTYQLSPPQVIDGGDFVKCVLPRPTQFFGFAAAEDLQSKIISLFHSQSELSTKEIIQALGVPRTTLHRALSDLLDAGVIKRTGRTHTTRYSLIR